MPAAQLYPTLLRGATLHWLVDLEWAGQTIRLAERTVTTPFGEDGEDIEYVGGLEFKGDVEDALDLFGTEPQTRTAAMTLHLQGILDVPDTVAQGHDLLQATGKLWLWVEGTGDRILMIDGEVRDPEYETDDDPIELSLEEAPFLDRGKMPDIDARVTLATWSERDPDIQDEFYPIIFGRPGIPATTVYGSPGQLVDRQAADGILLIAGHVVDATLVRVLGPALVSDDGGNVHEESIAGEDDLAVVTMDDGFGRTISYVDLTTAANVRVARGESYYIQWGQAGGGVPSPKSPSDDMRGAGEIIQWMLQRSTLRWDRGRFAAIADNLDQYLIDAALLAPPGDRIGPWDWLQDQLLPLLPISIRMGPEGIYPVLWRLDAGRNDALLELERGRNCARLGAVAYEGEDEIGGEYRLAYAARIEDDKPNRTAILSGIQATLDRDTSARRSLACKLARSRYGERAGVVELETPIIYDDATAFRILHWMVAAKALPTRVIGYQIDQSLAYLEPGDLVLLTDDEIAIDQHLAHVDQVTRRVTGVLDLSLRLYEDAGARLRS